MAKDQTFSNIVSEQVPWDIRVDWPTVYPVVGAFVFMFVMTITCIVSKKVADRRMKRKKRILPITDLRSIKSTEFSHQLTPNESPFEQPIILSKPVGLDHVSPCIKPDHVLILRVASPQFSDSYVASSIGAGTSGIRTSSSTTGIRTSSTATYTTSTRTSSNATYTTGNRTASNATYTKGTRTSSNTTHTTGIRTSSVGTSVAFQDQSYGDDDVFLSEDNLASTPIRDKSFDSTQIMRSISCPELFFK